jgi:hypothetical protein
MPTKNGVEGRLLVNPNSDLLDQLGHGHMKKTLASGDPGLVPRFVRTASALETVNHVS